MGEKVGTRDLDDGEIVDADNDENGEAISISSDGDNDDDDVPITKASSKTGLVKVKQEPGVASHVTRRAASNTLTTLSQRAPRALKTSGMELLSNISRSLDPGARAAREEERSARSLQSTQLLALTNQVRDSQVMLEDLRSRLSAAERRADNAELELRVERMTRGRQHNRSQSPHSNSRRHNNRRIRRETRYRGGGGCITWVTPSDEEDEMMRSAGHDNSDIEWRQYGTPRPTPQRPSLYRRRSASPINSRRGQRDVFGPVSNAAPFHLATTDLGPSQNQQSSLQTHTPTSSHISASPSHIKVSVVPANSREPDISITVSPSCQVPPRYQQARACIEDVQPHNE